MKQMSIFDYIDAKEAEPEFSEETNLLAGILNACPKVKRDALRERISEVLGVEISDRKMRKMIETARQEGFIIANDQNGRGYYIPETLQELQILYRQNENRAMSILRQQKHIRREMAKWT